MIGDAAHTNDDVQRVRIVPTGRKAGDPVPVTGRARTQMSSRQLYGGNISQMSIFRDVAGGSNDIGSQCVFTAVPSGMIISQTNEIGWVVAGGNTTLV